MDGHSVAEYFAELARRLVAIRSVAETMQVLVDAAVEAVDGCDHASISYLKGKSLVSASSSDSVGEILDGIQTGANEGPCLDAIRENEAMVADDLETDERWSVYGPRAVESAGVRSSMGFPLHDGERTIGALNLFSETRGSFGGSDEQEALVSVLAAHATAALAAALHREEMQAALRSRDLIGQAKGLLMARTSVDEDEAFRILTRASQRTNVKVAEIARRLVQGEPLEERADPGRG